MDARAFHSRGWVQKSSLPLREPHAKSRTLTSRVFCGFLSTTHPDVVKDPDHSFPRAHSHPTPLPHLRQMLTQQTEKLEKPSWKLSRERA